LYVSCCICAGAAASGSGDSEKKEKAQKGGTAVKVNICTHTAGL